MVITFQERSTLVSQAGSQPRCEGNLARSPQGPRHSVSEPRRTFCSLGITAQELEAELFDPGLR